MPSRYWCSVAGCDRDCTPEEGARERTQRPGAVHDPEREPLREARGVCAVRRERQAWRVEAAEADPCEDREHGDRNGAGRGCEASAHERRGRQGDPRRPQRPAAIDKATEERVDQRLERDRDEEDQRDREGRPASVGERERREHHQHPEEHRRQRVQPETAHEANVVKGTADAHERELLASIRLRPRREHGEDERDQAKRDEGRPHADIVGDGSENGAEHGAEDGRPEGGPEHGAALLLRSRGGDPGQRAGPGRRAREPLKEARGRERLRAVAERERDARDCEEDQAEDDRGLGPEPRGGDPPGIPPRTAPAPNAPTRIPAPSRDRPNVRAYSGTSGVSAVKSRASTKMIDVTRTRSRRIRRGYAQTAESLGSRRR